MDAPPKNEPDKTPPAYGKGSNFVGKVGRSGPAKGNDNAMRHGLKAGKLPKGCGYIEKRINAFRRGLEAVVLEAKGEISLVDAAQINSAIKWERHGLLAHHWLRTRAEELSPNDLLRFSEATAKASDSRDRAIKALQLDRDTRDTFIESLYAPQSVTTKADEGAGQ